MEIVPRQAKSQGSVWTAEKEEPVGSFRVSCFADEETPTPIGYKQLPAHCSQAHRPWTSWNQKVDDAQLPHHQPIRRMPTNWSQTPNTPPSLCVTILLRAFWEFWGLLSTSSLNSLLGACSNCCPFSHHNPPAVDCPYHLWISGPKFGSGINQVWFPRQVSAPSVLGHFD